MLKKYIVWVLLLCIINLTAGGGSSVENTGPEKLPSKAIFDSKLKGTLFEELAKDTQLTSELANRRLAPIVIISTIARNYDRYFHEHKIPVIDQDTMFSNTNDLLEILFEAYPKTLQNLKESPFDTPSSDQE